MATVWVCLRVLSNYFYNVNEHRTLLRLRMRSSPIRVWGSGDFCSRHVWQMSPQKTEKKGTAAANRKFPKIVCNLSWSFVNYVDGNYRRVLSASCPGWVNWSCIFYGCSPFPAFPLPAFNLSPFTCLAFVYLNYCPSACVSSCLPNSSLFVSN